MASYRIDRYGKFRSTRSEVTKLDIFEILINSEKFRHGVSVAHKVMKNAPFKIAGGFLRDIVCNKPVKDLDIFTDNSRLFPDHSQNNYEHNKNIICTGYTNYDKEKVNVVLVKRFASITKEFPLNISKICFSSTGILNITDEFLEDVNNKVLTLGDRKYYNEDYVKRIRDKYRDYKQEF